MKGNCLCGAVSYEIAGPLSMMIHCHCSMCRKHHGAAFATFVGAPLSGYRLLSGEDVISHYQSSPAGHRHFCSVCGSVTPIVSKEMDMVFCPAGNLEGDLGMLPSAHYFAGSKAPWYEITDDLPQHVEFPTEFNMSGVERPHVEAEADTVAGSCLCGDVTFTVVGTPVRITNCHCTRCRRARSAAHASNFFYPLAAFTFTRGADSLSDYRYPEARYFAATFCRRCGSAMPRVSLERGIVVIPGGGLDSDPKGAPTSHIFVGSKAPWFDITDQLPQHETMPANFSPPPAVR